MVSAASALARRRRHVVYEGKRVPCVSPALIETILRREFVRLRAETPFIYRQWWERVFRTTLAFYRCRRVFLARGTTIHKHLNLEFEVVNSRWGNGSSPNSYIPSDAIWFDARYIREMGFFLIVHVVEMRGDHYQRTRRLLLKRLGCVTTAASSIVFARVRLWGFTVCLVDGEKVRRTLDPAFLVGGHSLVYSYIPKRHIWLDMWSDPSEWEYSFYHEYHEHLRMRRRWNYDRAHDFANVHERDMRSEDGARYPGDEGYIWRDPRRFLIDPRIARYARELARQTS